MCKFIISIFCITILLAFSLKYSGAFTPTYSLKKELAADEKAKAEKNESSEEENDSKEDLKKNEFVACYSSYFLTENSSQLIFANHHTSLPTIFQLIPKLPPRIS